MLQPQKEETSGLLTWESSMKRTLDLHSSKFGGRGKSGSAETGSYSLPALLTEGCELLSS